ncbi:phosphatase PAP2 family protein [Sphingomonas parva]|uniref:phosphatase PAP2 family protein n=1 Tax=Sphingomonas parva TaxID=2555898 RepID=UPI001CDC33C7|nr:phosphatase PAP2 family protein [Sphingomonas parva]
MVEQTRRMLWAGVLACTAVAWLGCWRLGIGVGLSSAPIALSMISLAGLAYLRKPTWALWVRRLLDLLELLFLLAAVGYSGALLSYAAMGSTSGYTDDLLVRLDAMLGFDWLKIRLAAEQHGWMMELGRAAYASFFLSPLILLPALVLTGRSSDAYRFLLAYALAVLLTNLLFAAFPAESAFQHFMPDRRHAWGDGPLRYLEAIHQLRAGTMAHVHIDRLQGIVTFPSFHASAAFLFIWGAWPLRPLRAPMFAINSAMLVSATFFGGHYVVDILGGVALAWFSIQLVAIIERRIGAATPAASLADGESAPADVSGGATAPAVR